MRALLLLALALAAATPAPAQEPLTEASLRAMPPDALSLRLLGESAAIAFPLPPEQQTRGAHYDGMIWIRFRTRPRASPEPGVCETAVLTILLEPLGAPGPDTPLRPRSMAMSPAEFIVQDLRTARTSMWPNWPEDILDRRSDARRIEARGRLDAACAAIDPRQAEPVFADHAGQVGRAVALVAAMLDSARAGRTPAPVACQDGAGSPLSNGNCLRLLAALRVESLNQVEMVDGCWGMDRPGAFALENRCLRARLWDAQRRDRIEIEFVFRWGRQELIRIAVQPKPVLTGDY
jgi:hypothetical protein